MKRKTVPQLDPLRQVWQAAWPEALAVWSRYVQLHEPAWCYTVAEERRHRLQSSFAMIRLVDHSVVISLRQVAQRKLEAFAKEILAHEIGHHVYCPGDLTDHGRLLARIRRGLPTQEARAPTVSNLYTDLLINDWLQRTAGLRMAEVYQTMGTETGSRVWFLYMRIYEVLWKLDRGALVSGQRDSRIDLDAQLGARLIRSFSKEWLDGAGRFAMLMLPYLLEDQQDQLAESMAVWKDTECAAEGGCCPDGLAERDDAEEDGAIHPAEDPELTGIGEELDQEPETDSANAGVLPGTVGRKTEKNYRQPFEYREVLKALRIGLSDREMTARYYRERALPHLIPFPVQRQLQAVDPLPEGLEVWDIDAPLDQIDWLGTLATSPLIVPGVTTRQRLMGEGPGTERGITPVDLYLGVDNSGSMDNPAGVLSYPVLAGAILALSALRGGAKVKVVLSGEPGRTVAMEDFSSDQHAILQMLTDYLGTGYGFGIHRLAETFTADQRRRRPVHILIVSDNDMFSMLDERGDGRLGWEVASEALQRCGGGGTFVLQLPPHVRQPSWNQPTDQYLNRIQAAGWDVHLVDSMEELVAFARKFSRRQFQR